MTTAFTESVIEDAALAWLEGLGWTLKHGLEIAPGEFAAERAGYGQVVLERRLREAIATTVLQQTQMLGPLLREEIELVVRESVEQALADELTASQAAAQPFPRAGS